MVLDLAPGGAAMAVAGSGSESVVSGERKESQEREVTCSNDFESQREMGIGVILCTPDVPVHV